MDRSGRSARPAARERPELNDHELVRALQVNGRASIHELAQGLGVSRDLVSQRLKRLIAEEGLRIVAAVDPGFSGQQVLVHGMVDVDGAAADTAARLAAFPETVLVSLVSGSRPIVFESRHADVAELDGMLSRVREIPAVSSVRITNYAEVLKGFFVSRARTSMTPDEIDLELIAILQRDGRTSFTALSEAVNLSPSSVRERVVRLIDAGVIRISAIQPGGVSRSRFSLGLGIALRGGDARLREIILASPNIDFAARTHGAHYYVATVHGHISDEVLRVIESLRGLPEVDSLDSWTHLDLVKEEYARSVGHIPRARHGR